MTAPRLALVDRFFLHVEKNGRTMPGMESACWEWTAARASTGYGVIRVSGKTVGAHRLVHRLEGAGVPPGKCVCHRCDNKGCVRPDHHFFGTLADNTHDRVAKERAAGRPIGVRGPRGRYPRRLKPDEVVEIVACLKRGERRGEIALKFRVRPEVIGDIGNGRSWSGITKVAA